MGTVQVPDDERDGKGRERAGDIRPGAPIATQPHVDQHQDVGCPQKDTDDKIHFDVEANIIVGRGHVAMLTPTQMELAIVLRDRFPRAVSKGDLLEALYLHDSDQPGYNILSVMVCRIRAETKGTGFGIDTVWGRGWRMTPIPEDKP